MATMIKSWTESWVTNKIDEYMQHCSVSRQGKKAREGTHHKVSFNLPWCPGLTVHQLPGSSAGSEQVIDVIECWERRQRLPLTHSPCPPGNSSHPVWG
eukprot:2960123-Rhodomonas_salina.1